MAKIEIKFNKDRIEELVTVDEFIGLQEGNVKTAKSVVGKFVVDASGNYVPEEEGAKLVGQLTVRQLTEVLEAFKAGIKGIVPNENSATSD